MTEEERKEEAAASEEEPQIYTVKKDMDGWQFNRRAFLTAAGATAAAAALGTAAACGEPAGDSAPEVVTNWQNKLQEAGADWELVIFGGDVRHGFTNKDAGDFGTFSVNYEQADDVTGVNPDDNANFWLGWSKDF